MDLLEPSTSRYVSYILQPTLFAHVITILPTYPPARTCALTLSSHQFSFLTQPSQGAPRRSPALDCRSQPSEPGPRGNSTPPPLDDNVMFPTNTIISPSIDSPFISNTTMKTSIASMYSTDEPDAYIFQCDDSACKQRTFNRWYDFRRHYNGAHATAPTVYWCESTGCPRSKAVGDRPFPRKDKLNDHIQAIHGGRA